MPFIGPCARGGVSPTLHHAQVILLARAILLHVSLSKSIAELILNLRPGLHCTRLLRNLHLRLLLDFSATGIAATGRPGQRGKRHAASGRQCAAQAGRASPGIGWAMQ